METAIAPQPQQYVNEQFDLLMQQNFGTDPARIAIDAMMEQQLTYGNLSLDDQFTSYAMSTEKGMNALTAPNFVIDGLASWVAYSQQQSTAENHRQHRLLEDSEAEA